MPAQIAEDYVSYPEKTSARMFHGESSSLLMVFHGESPSLLLEDYSGKPGKRLREFTQEGEKISHFEVVWPDASSLKLFHELGP